MEEEMLLRAPRIRSRSPIFPLESIYLEPLFVEDDSESEFRLENDNEDDDFFGERSMYISINESAAHSSCGTFLPNSWLRKIEAKQLSSDNQTLHGHLIYSLMINEKISSFSSTTNLR
jgi:hypothetical protein